MDLDKTQQKNYHREPPPVRLRWRLTLEKQVGDEVITETLVFDTFRSARKAYRSQVLNLYRSNFVRHFRCCLNRLPDQPWDNPVYLEESRKDFRMYLG